MWSQLTCVTPKGSLNFNLGDGWHCMVIPATAGLRATHKSSFMCNCQSYFTCSGNGTSSTGFTELPKCRYDQCISITCQTSNTLKQLYSSWKCSLFSNWKQPVLNGMSTCHVSLRRDLQAQLYWNGFNSLRWSPTETIIQTGFTCFDCECVL